MNARLETKKPARQGNRMRRLRAGPGTRTLVRETDLTLEHLVQPIFVHHGVRVREPVPSMPGIHQLSVDEALVEAEGLLAKGIRAVIVFGIPEVKDPAGSMAWDYNAPVQRFLREARRRFPELTLIADVCLCEYTDHGHCGIVKDGKVDNDATLEALATTAVSLSEAGAHIVAPSAMMDGQVAAIREALDAHGLIDTPIMAYSAKFASAFYGPFRQAADSAPKFGDRRGYQMDPPNAREALREIEIDIAEGADIVMVKPALAYLDVIWRAREAFTVPLAAYNVSGEYSMVKAAAAQGWIDERLAVTEILTGIVRAGADVVISYHAADFAGWIRQTL
jgi:porphobilinogen synthase